MIDFENLRGQWENILRIERGYTFVDTAPLEYHIGYDEKLRRTLLILCKRKMKIPSSFSLPPLKMICFPMNANEA